MSSAGMSASERSENGLSMEQEEQRKQAARAVTGKVLLGVFLVSVGLSLIVYGVRFHSEPVLVEQEVEPPAAEPAPPLFFTSRPPVIAPPAGKELVSLRESEPHLIREITVGGVTRLDSGEIKRTYTGKPPTACPT